MEPFHRLGPAAFVPSLQRKGDDLDVDAILETVQKTNRVVYLEDNWPYAGTGAQVVSIIQEEAFDHLDAPVLRVTQADVPMPYAKNLEALAKPTVERVVEACNKVLYR